VADGEKGLLRISSNGEVSLLTDAVGGVKMIFVDDLDIASDGKIWFSDASTRFGLHDNMLDFMESRVSGRLLSYDPATGETRIELDGLAFANGVALAQDESFVLINETFRHRVTRFWLTGDKAGQSEPFIENLPGHPDNLSRAPNGEFWVALVAPRTDELDGLMPYPFWRKVIARLPASFTSSPVIPYGWIVGLNKNGEVIHDLQDPSGHYTTITSVNEHEGLLYLSSLTENAVGQLIAP